MPYNCDGMDEASDWSVEVFGAAVLELMPSGFFKSGASYEEAYLIIRDLVKSNKKQLLDIAKKQRPDNWHLEFSDK